MNTGAQDWAMSDAAREILVLTKTDIAGKFSSPLQLAS
jgi:hypothetical protein